MSINIKSIFVANTIDNCIVAMTTATYVYEVNVHIFTLFLFDIGCWINFDIWKICKDYIPLIIEGSFKRIKVIYDNSQDILHSLLTSKVTIFDCTLYAYSKVYYPFSTNVC